MDLIQTLYCTCNVSAPVQYAICLKLNGLSVNAGRSLVVKLMLDAMENNQMKLNTENDEVFECSITVDEARKIVDGELPEALISGIDEAQGYVFMDKGAKSYLVIEITTG